MYNCYHTGAYGLLDGIRWSCCKDDKRDSPGCKKVLSGSEPPSWHRSQLSLIPISVSDSLVAQQPRQQQDIPPESPMSVSETYGTLYSESYNDLQLDDAAVQRMYKYNNIIIIVHSLSS